MARGGGEWRDDEMGGEWRVATGRGVADGAGNHGSDGIPAFAGMTVEGE
jgi:hypothetical protein